MLLPRILEILKPQSDDHSVRVTVPSWMSLTPEMRGDFRKSLTRHLFGWDVLLSLRMRLSLADFAWVSSSCRQRGLSRILLEHRLETFRQRGKTRGVWSCRAELVEQNFPSSAEDYNPTSCRLCQSPNRFVTFPCHSLP